MRTITKNLGLLALLITSLTLAGCNSSSGSGDSASDDNAGDNPANQSATPGEGELPSALETWIHPLPQGYSLNAVVEHNNHFVAVGVRGTVLRSSNGIDWEASATAPTALRGLSTNGQTLVAVGGGTGPSSGGRIFYSEDDGGTWSEASLDEQVGGLNVVTWTGNDFVALGNQTETNVKSTDGKSWTKVDSGPSLRTEALAANGGRLVTGSLHRIYLSEDGGATWSNEDSITSGANSNVADMLYDGSQFALAGGYNQWGFRESSNGKNWSKESVDFNYSFPNLRLSALTFADNHYWFTDTDGRIHKRAAATPDWTEVADIQSEELRSITHSSSGFVAVGENGAMLHSSNGDTWQNISESSLSAANWAGMAASASGRMVAISENGYAVYSDDGEDWTEVSLSGTPFLTDIHWTGTRFVVSGTNAVAHSSDGETWTVVDPRTNTGSNLFLSHVAGRGDNWIAMVGNSLANDQIAICTPSGCSMDEAPDASRSLVATDDGYLVISFSGWARVSSDGDEWTTEERALQTTNMGFVRLSSIGNKVVAASPSNSHLHTAFSNDGGLTWTSVDFPDDASVTAAAIFNDGERFFIRDNGRNSLWVSNDGSDWEAFSVRHPVSGMAVKNDTLILLGEGSHILSIPDL